MSKSRAVPPLEPKRCALCGGMLGERRPVFLIAENTGAILGRYHAGCAAKLVEAHRGKDEMPGPNAAEELGHTLIAREETLPW